MLQTVAEDHFSIAFFHFILIIWFYMKINPIKHLRELKQAVGTSRHVRQMEPLHGLTFSPFLFIVPFISFKLLE